MNAQHSSNGPVTRRLRCALLATALLAIGGLATGCHHHSSHHRVSYRAGHYPSGYSYSHSYSKSHYYGAPVSVKLRYRHHGHHETHRKHAQHRNGDHQGYSSGSDQGRASRAPAHNPTRRARTDNGLHLGHHKQGHPGRGSNGANRQRQGHPGDGPTRGRSPRRP